ncbi:tyrosine-type recombinase/integrase [Marinobacterium stanieri]|uniref:Phage integrase family protein n=1 Tax=Marinobacterium stanieri TaxID=49186 RepID=A0A1N6XC74_9GAMM|nr:tyrosine-type recombinase/integrase [Marinobacterium stanieri]SIQ99831.1 Phage integrase family protein [Marinobacterium stanieri]
MIEHSLDAGHLNSPWNKGKLLGQKRPLKLKEIWGIRIRLELAGKTRDLAMFNLAIDSKLRGCDLMNLKVKDISHGTTIQSRAIIIQKKTGKPVQFEITKETRKSLRDWIGQKRLTSNDFLFPSRVVSNRPLTTRQYARIVDQWVTSVGLDVCDYGTHTMRRTKPTLIYRRTHDLRAVQLLLGHSKLDSTIRYLGVELDDALVLAEQTDV